jgi:hypothetical protein
MSAFLVATPIANDNPTAIGSSACPLESEQNADVSSAPQTIDNALSTWQETTEQPHSPKETDSKTASETITNDDQVDVTQLPQLARAAISIFGQDGVPSLEHIFDVIHDKVVRDVIGGALLHTAMQNGYQETFEATLQLRSEVREWALNEVVKTWARADPESALEAAWSLGTTNPASQLLQRRVALEWAEADPTTVLENMKVIPHAIKDLVEEKALISLARIAPLDAIEYLPKWFATMRGTTLAKEIVTHWVRSDPNACIAWVKSFGFSSPELRTEVMETAFKSYARQDPELAFEAALNQPKHSSNEGMEANVIAEVAAFDPSRAVGMLSRIRDDAITELHSHVYIAQELIRTHFDFDKPIRIGRKIRPVWQDYYYHRVIPYWALYQPVELLNRIHQFPDAHRSYVAASLIRANSVAHVLNAQQITNAERHLNKDELKEVYSSLPEQ